MPVPRRIRLVTAARYARLVSGSSTPDVGRAGIRPSGEYGYFEPYSSKSTTCSATQSESKPRASAVSPNART